MLISLAAFVHIAAKAFQQNSVVYKKWKWVPPMSYIMAAMEMFIVVSIVREPSLWNWAQLGTGGFLGCWFSMWIHPKLTGRGWG